MLRRLQEANVWEGMLASKSFDDVVIDSITIEAKRDEMIGYDGFKHRNGLKVHVIVDKNSMPIASAISPGNTHDSKVLMSFTIAFYISLGGYMGIQHTMLIE
ncbi:MAG: transposase [Candidatus Methanomethylicia archaeon]